MKHKLTTILSAAGFALTLSSCEIILNDFIGTGYHNRPAVQTGTNAAQTGFNNGIHWQTARYDDYGVPIYGYADGRPVYGYTKQGSLIYQTNLLYSGCYVPAWGSSAYHPQGVIRTPKSPL